jgi:hypothetical protein
MTLPPSLVAKICGTITQRVEQISQIQRDWKTALKPTERTNSGKIQQLGQQPMEGGQIGNTEADQPVKAYLGSLGLVCDVVPRISPKIGPTQKPSTSPYILFSVSRQDRIEVWVQVNFNRKKLLDIVPPIYPWSASASVTDLHPNQDSTKFIGEWHRLSPGHFLSEFSVPVARILYRSSASGNFIPDHGRNKFGASDDAFIRGAVAGHGLALDRGFNVIGSSQPRNKPEDFPIPSTQLSAQFTGEALASTSELNLRIEAVATAGRPFEGFTSSSLTINGTINAEFFPEFSIKNSYLSVSSQTLYCWVQWGIEGGKQGVYIVTNRFDLNPVSIEKYTQTLEVPAPDKTQDFKHFLASFEPPVLPENACVAQFASERGSNFPTNQMTAFDLEQDINGTPFSQAILLGNIFANYNRFNIGVQEKVCELPSPIPGTVLAQQINPEDFQVNSEQIEILAAAVF